MVPGAAHAQPAVQLEGRALPSGHCVPGGQGKRVGACVPVGQKCPGGQGPEHSGELSCVVLPYRPAGHCAATKPVVLLKTQ